VQALKNCLIPVDKFSPVARRNARSLTEEEFFDNFLAPNKAVLIEDATAGWSACSEWVSSDNAVNVDAVSHSLGPHCECKIIDCTHGASSLHTEESSLSHFAQQWADRGRRKLYMKDLSAKAAQSMYSTPIFFAEDHLNAYWDALRESACGSEHEISLNTHHDHRFVYIGTEGTFTPIHHDVLKSFSWSANVCGEKLWILFPPGEEEKLHEGSQPLPSVFSCSKISSDLQSSVAKVEGALICVQEANSAIFVPSGWHHEVLNLTDCLSINHNWLNLHCNAQYGFDHLIRQHESLVSGLPDPEDKDDIVLHENLLEQQCQMTLGEMERFVKWALSNEVQLARKNNLQSPFERRKRKIALKHGINLLRETRDAVDLKGCRELASLNAMNALGFAQETDDEVLRAAAEALQHLY